MTMVLNESGGGVAIEAGQSPASSVAWGAIIAGAVAGAAVSLLLVLLGSGLGLTVISPWGSNPNLTTIAATTLIWLVVVHWVASAIGGYLTGRLRTRWSNVHGDEVFFRDTAHGFLTWGLAVLLVASLAGMAASSVLFAGLQSAGTVAGGAVQGATQGAAQGVSQAASQGGGNPADPTSYFVDTLFRPAMPTPPAAAPGGTPGATSDVRTEVSRILVKDIPADQFPDEDRTYLGNLVAAQTGVTPDVARMRVDSVVNALEDAKAKAKAAADAARKAGATAALGLVLALLIGAFVSSASAAYGGHLRDDPTA